MRDDEKNGDRESGGKWILEYWGGVSVGERRGSGICLPGECL